MMKIKTLFIAPYPAMTPLIDECRQEDPDLDIHIEVANLQEAIPLAQAGESQGYDVIISRGGTAKLIEPEVAIPVIDVHVSGYDMLRVLTLANDFPGKKAIVGFSNITLGAKAITDVLDIEIEVCTVEKAGEVDSILEELKDKGYELIMGDVVTIEAAAKYRLEGILIQSGREAIFEAFQRAKSVHRLYRRKEWEISFLHSLLAETANNLIVLDRQGEVVYQNWADYDSCPVSVDELSAGIRENPDQTRVLTVQERGQRKLKQKRILKYIQGKPYYLFDFSEMKESTGQVAFPVEAVSQLPMIIARSESMAGCLAAMEHHLESDSFILIGETGTGKQLLSRYIHFKKHDRKGLYAALTAKQALTEIEGEGFDDDIKTVYINGIDMLSPNEISNLQALVRAERSRGRTVILAFEKEDPVYQSLLFDEQSVRVNVPALRERKEDIKALATYYIAAYHGTLGTSPVKLKDEAAMMLEGYSWPGNVAELRTLLKDAVTEEKGYVIGRAQISRHLGRKQIQHSVNAGLPADFLQGTLDEIEKRIIHAVMKEEHDNQTRVAERLGINRSTLWRKLKQ
ncbi:PrpR N-terminal domain-containing protein [Paenibacillus sp. FSL K6-1566]|uniref:Transcriptional regulator with PAS, ATPase and Fis domain n=1 Tax=Paenibacillus lactis TaxID=228574 RepID=A0ABS4F729_9BACL|nr:sigma-54-dependent transcriptional regulator [Paenibacillus lactis]MBP1892049.1 transcriptional regulator with PAS, ATPase and Fis domain [Paenibacillus lactis]